MKSILAKDLIKFSEEDLMPSISNTRRFFEIGAVAITAIGKFVFMGVFNFRLNYVITAITFWSIYIVCRYKKENGILRYWGFRTDNFISVTKLMLPFAIISIVVFFIVGYFQNSIDLSWHIIPIMFTYPIWGIIQQFLVMALVAGNLNHLKGIKIGNGIVIFVTAALFSIVHFPSNWLMAGTFVLAIFYGIVYLNVKNIYVMGIMHGWMGALFYYTVLNQDPFYDIFIKLFY